MSTHETKARAKSGTTIDWQSVHRRLDATNARIERMWAPDTEEARQILKTRARSLAQAPAKADVAAEYLEIVEFALAYERYAIESRFVREVCPLDDLSPLPCTPAFVLGIVSVRGEIISVIDLKAFFDLPEQGISDLHRIIVLESENMLFGILADTILGVRRIPLAKLQPSLPTLTGVREIYLKGVTPDRMIVLDAEKLLTSEKVIVNETVEV